jgi:hypothetical protein
MDDIALRILSYLAANPEANDTPEGIAQWWLLDREIRDQTEAVERALAELADAGWLIVRGNPGSPGSPVRYRLNPARAGEVRALLEGTP